uniref:Nucleocapsid n=1 Tax=Human respirovirus 1 TaxID=12730 RepID=A0A286RZM7_9MONO|nr:nucleoprotein [Human respirovirus 1]ATV91605.1 nucleoprotein [Human respirovirus 1]
MAGLLSTFDTFSSRRSESINKSGGGAIIPGQRSTVSVFTLGPSVTDDADKLLIATTFLAHSLDTDKQHSQRGGFLVSLLAMAYSSPELYLTTNGVNADVKYVIYSIERDPKRTKTDGFIVKTRDMEYERTTEWLFGPMVNKNPLFQGQRENADLEALLQTYGYPACLGAIIVQVWIVLVKAITSSAGLRKGFFNRLEAFRQDGTVKSALVFTGDTVEGIGAVMRSQQSLVSLMVETLVTMNTSRSDLTTLEKNIQIVGNYIRDAGLASFMNTIKYGVETKMAALTLSNLRPDLNKLRSLVDIYLSKGARAPFICILRDPVHGDFAPGNYPALWSYAMGVAVVQNKAMQQYVTGRTYLDMEMFLLGQAVAKDADSKISSALEEELGVTDTAKERLRHHLTNLSGGDGAYHKPTGGGAIEVAIDHTDITFGAEDTADRDNKNWANDSNERWMNHSTNNHTITIHGAEELEEETNDEDIIDIENKIARRLADRKQKLGQANNKRDISSDADYENDDDATAAAGIGGI